MSGAHGPPVAQAAATFRRLGYTVSEERRQFVATRKWRTVAVSVVEPEASVTPVLADGGAAGDTGEAPDLRCYVTDREGAARLANRVASLNPADDWAVVGVVDNDHTVVRAP